MQLAASPDSAVSHKQGSSGQTKERRKQTSLIWSAWPNRLTPLPLEKTPKELSLKRVPFEIFDQNDEEAWSDQQKDNDKDKDKDNYKDQDKNI